MIGDESKTVDCARRLLGVLLEQDDWLHQGDLRQLLLDDGADLDYVGAGAKYLRDRAYPVITIRRAKDSVWKVASTRQEFDYYLDQVARGVYSEAVSDARAAGGMPGAGRVRMKAVTTAVVMGERLGTDPALTVEECKPLVRLGSFPTL